MQVSKLNKEHRTLWARGHSSWEYQPPALEITAPTESTTWGLSWHVTGQDPLAPVWLAGSAS